MTSLTEKEQTVLEALIDNLYAEPGFSDVCVDDLSQVTGLSKNAVGGVLTSLQNKEYVSVSEPEVFNGRVEIPSLVYLREDHYDLHPKWKDTVLIGKHYRVKFKGADVVAQVRQFGNTFFALIDYVDQFGNYHEDDGVMFEDFVRRANDTEIHAYKRHKEDAVSNPFSSFNLV